ncbi:MAG TPA: type II toxin-antitoxin system VapC family toxin [Thermoanaerobaculia bacterium]
MIPPGRLLLDTNILVHLVRSNRLGEAIDSRFQLRARTKIPLVSVVTVGEILGLSKKWSWGALKIQRLEDLLQQFILLDINSEDVLSTYAELDSFLEKSGKPIEQNDIWIAANTIVAGAHLLTTDKDFDPLYPAFLDRTWIDPQRPLF